MLQLPDMQAPVALGKLHLLPQVLQLLASVCSFTQALPHSDWPLEHPAQTPPAAQVPLAQLAFAVPCDWVAQVPFALPVSDALQAWQVPLQALLQQ
jgi:hypothetical protein